MVFRPGTREFPRIAPATTAHIDAAISSNREIAFEQAAHDLFALGYEDLLLPLLVLPPQGPVRREFRQIQSLDSLNMQHTDRKMSVAPKKER
ncbi:MAG: hypothetical protein DME26_06810 [Verrucomicrobia bacterium]|nr:MAG: hypothetical protein DME26_06810 [Verrucomicrobiota bacterium]